MATGVENGAEDQLHLVPAASRSFWDDWLSWLYAGVDPNLAGNGGPDCATFIPTSQKLLETFVFVTIGLAEIWYAWPRMNTSLAGGKGSAVARSCQDSVGRRVMLMVMCLTFGAELGFKLASRQLIWILNPCHLVTMMQIYILVSPPSKLVTAVFRIQLHCLNGATIAILFPILNTRTMPFETQTYYIQHALLLVVPIYLLRLRGAYTPEPFSDFSWVSFTLGLLLIYHFLPLQCLALLSLVNLNNMMCPAVSDPFYSRWYRVAAASHQTLLILFHGKLYTYLCTLLVVPATTTSSKHVESSHENGKVCTCCVHSCGDPVCNNSNGYTKLH
jgi:hypothetical protein